MNAFWAWVLTLMVVPMAALAQDFETLVEQALDAPVELNVQELALTKAFEQIAEQTGVSVRISDDVLALLPYGANTKVNAEMRGISLRQGLDELTGALGLCFVVIDRGLEVLPRPALQRIGRRATWSELDLLNQLAHTNVSADPAALDRLEQQIQFRIEGVNQPWSKLRPALGRVGAGSLDDVLTVACDGLDWVWHPEDKVLVVLTKTQQLERQLEQVVALRESHQPLVQVLQAIGDQIGAPVRLEPAVVAQLPVQITEDFSLYVENKTARQVLDLIAGTAGLAYHLDADQVLFTLPGQAAAMTTKPTSTRQRMRSDPYVGKFILPGADGVQIELLIRESDLDPEVNALRLRYLERANQAIKDALSTEFKASP